MDIEDWVSDFGQTKYVIRRNIKHVRQNKLKLFGF